MPTRVTIHLDQLKKLAACDEGVAAAHASHRLSGEVLVYEDFEAEVPRLAGLCDGKVLWWLVSRKLVPLTMAAAMVAIHAARPPKAPKPGKPAAPAPGAKV